MDTGDAADTGAKILGVTSGSPAATAGLKKGDVVTAVEGEKVADGIALIVAIRAHQPGETVRFTVERGAACAAPGHARLAGRLTSPSGRSGGCGRPVAASACRLNGWVST